MPCDGAEDTLRDDKLINEEDNTVTNTIKMIWKFVGFTIFVSSMAATLIILAVVLGRLNGGG